jgi:hypothetical protein
MCLRPEENAFLQHRIGQISYNILNGQAKEWPREAQSMNSGSFPAVSERLGPQGKQKAGTGAPVPAWDIG